MSSDTRDPIVLIGGFGSHWADYKPVASMLSHVSGRRVFIVGIHRLSWMVGAFVDYTVMIDRVHNAVTHALAESGAQKAVLVGHSAGGVIGRTYLGDRGIKPHHAGYNGHARVSRLITLGSPLRAAPGATRAGMRQASWVDQTWPGAYYPGVQYLTVCGNLVEGKADGTRRERQAYQAYAWVSSAGAQWGDGTIPGSISTLDGVPSITLEGVGHSPDWGRWYFSSLEVIRSWWHYFDLGDAPAAPDALRYA